MWQRYTFYDFRVIGHYLGVLMVFLSIAMIVPFIVALVSQEWEPAARYLFSMGLSLCIGTGMRMMRIEPGHLNRQQAIAVTGFAWVVIAAVAAIPLALSSHYADYWDALFDSVSLFTTTGVTIISDPDHLSNADNMWRFAITYAGGIGLVVVALSFGLFGRVVDSSLYESEGRSEHVLPNVVQTGQFIVRFSLVVMGIATAIIMVLLLLKGMKPTRALLHGFWLSLSGFMTVGLAPMSTNVGYYHSFAIEMVMIVLMLLGSINFGLQSEVMRGRVKEFFKDIEIRSSVIWIALILVVFVAALSSSDALSRFPALARTGLFTIVSAFTTSGFDVLNGSQITMVVPSGALLVLAIAMAVGGSSSSTAGGIKLRRVAIIAKSAGETLKGVASPDSARIVTNYYHIGRRRLSGDEVKSAMTVTIMFIIMYVIGSLVGVAMGYDAVSAITESIAMASNGGITTGITTASMPGVLKAVYVIEMWAGRLEFVTLLAVGIKIIVSLKPRKPKWMERDR